MTPQRLHPDPRVALPPWPSKIISGGQTGADRGALDAALVLGIPHGGWCPPGRKAEDGVIPARYRLQEGRQGRHDGYPWRTRVNVENAHATLVFHPGIVGKGTSIALRHAKRIGRPVRGFTLRDDTLGGTALLVRAWLKRREPGTLNVGGSRESRAPGMRSLVYQCLLLALMGWVRNTSHGRSTLAAWRLVSPTSPCGVCDVSLSLAGEWTCDCAWGCSGGFTGRICKHAMSAKDLWAAEQAGREKARGR